ncbi:NEAT domain-containing protein [Gemella sp. zg-1178]|uniref:NEAT domain-containing protein n=1 Tax=Gemella sp. zg-1178 TaxID=2840372 RepID=UPI001C04D894|nr:NEAT domain-containing protein [Gemella sp. zg-1178]MBU0279274.1 NEAT domain-containing protein [Gemella sp. zg-1178]
MKKHKIISLSLASALLFSTGLYSAQIAKYNTAYATESSSLVKDYKTLKDGEYDLTFSVKNASNSNQLSMADEAMIKPAKLTVSKGQYKVKIKFQPIEVSNLKGYLGDLFYYDTANKKSPASALTFYSPEEKDSGFDEYKKKYQNRSGYPKEFEFPIDKTAIKSDGKLTSKIGVYVPVMGKYGEQDALIDFDFSNLAINKANTASRSSENEKFVSLKISDESPLKTATRRAIEKIGKIKKNNGKKELVLTYYSQQKWGVNHIYDNGLMNVWYNYDGSQNRTKLTSKIIESGDHYKVSELAIPINEDKPIYIFGETQLNAYTGTTQVTYAIVNINGDTSLASTKNNSPKLLRASQFGAFEKDFSEKKLPFDYKKGDRLFSPYTAEQGTKFKLADGRFSLELNFERPDIQNTDIRYLKYTLDGSEPTNSSSSADLRSQSSDLTLPSSLYRIFIEPLADIKNFSENGGDVTLKVKAFNAKGNPVSDTQTYTFPFSKHYIDEIPFKLNIADKTFDAKLSSDVNYVLTNEVSVQSEKADYLKEKLKDKIAQLALNDVTYTKISLLKDGKPYTPDYPRGWLEDKNPLLKVDISNYSSDVNKQVYLYNSEDGSLNLVPTVVTSTKFSFSVNQQEGIYIIATANNKQLLDKEKEKLTKRVEEAKQILESASISKERIRLNQEIEKAENLLNRKFIKLYNLIKAGQNIDRAIKNLENAKSNTIFLKRKIATNNEILDQDILKKLLTQEKYNKLLALKSEINNNLDNNEKLQELLYNLDEELSNLEYKYKTQDIDYMIENYSRPGVESMASGVFDNKNARLIFAPDKTYLEVNLKTMTIFNIRAHLTDLDIFKDKLDEEELNVYSLGKFEDTGLNGKPALFDRKLIIELEKDAKQEYVVRLGNDGMGGAKPQARLVIKTQIEKNTTSDIDIYNISRLINNTYEPEASSNNIYTSDFKNLPDGEYNLDFTIFNYYSPDKISMANGAVNKPAKLVVKNGEYHVELTFTPLRFAGQQGYLGNLYYYDKNGSKKQGTILSYYSENEIDNFIDIYKKAFPSRNAYPKVISYPLDKNDIEADGKLKTRINVFVPVMASINQEIGYQDALPIFYFKKYNVEQENLEKEDGITIKDEVNNVTIRGDKIPKNSKLHVKKLDEKIEKISDMEYDLYDIEIQNKDNNSKINVLGEINITAPKKQGKTIEKVYYVGDNGELEEKVITSQDKDTITFTTNHLSKYALVYANNSTVNNEGKLDPTANSNLSNNLNMADNSNLSDNNTSNRQGRQISKISKKLTKTGIENSTYPLLVLSMLAGAYALRRKLK